MDDGANERLLVPYCGPPLQRGFETASIIRRNTDGADPRSRLGPYAITPQSGVGGMGEVVGKSLSWVPGNIRLTVGIL